MPDYRRCFVAGGTYFFTVVTHLRRPILTDELGRTYLREAIDVIREKYDFEINAFVLLPEHLHCLWTLPPGDARYPLRWRRIKEEFTERFLERGGKEGPVSESRRRRNERGVWQRRYWEHTVRDEHDFESAISIISTGIRPNINLSSVPANGNSRRLSDGKNWVCMIPIGVANQREISISVTSTKQPWKWSRPRPARFRTWHSLGRVKRSTHRALRTRVNFGGRLKPMIVELSADPPRNWSSMFNFVLRA